MATTKSINHGAAKATSGKTREKGSERIARLSNSSSQIIRDAAELLDEEIAAGIVAAKQMQVRFQKERRVDANDFKKALDKFQTDAHEVVAMLNSQINQMSSEETRGLSDKLLVNVHGVIDLTVGMVNIGAELADELAQSNLKRKPKPVTKPVTAPQDL